MRFCEKHIREVVLHVICFEEFLFDVSSETFIILPLPLCYSLIRSHDNHICLFIMRWNNSQSDLDFIKMICRILIGAVIDSARSRDTIFTLQI